MLITKLTNKGLWEVICGKKGARKVYYDDSSPMNRTAP